MLENGTVLYRMSIPVNFLRKDEVSDRYSVMVYRTVQANEETNGYVLEMLIEDEDKKFVPGPKSIIGGEQVDAPYDETATLESRYYTSLEVAKSSGVRSLTSYVGKITETIQHMASNMKDVQVEIKEPKKE
jgi:hypothetical protein